MVSGVEIFLDWNFPGKKRTKFIKHEARGQVRKARERLTLGKDVNSVSHFLSVTDTRDVRVILYISIMIGGNETTEHST